MQSFSGHRLDCYRGERRVLHDVDFSVTRGGALLLTGPNGCGKSSLLRAMAGLLRLGAGTIVWNDQDIADDLEAHRARVAYIGHLDALKPVLNVRENVGFWAELAGSPGDRTAVDRSVDEALAAFGIGHLAELPARILSQGQRRRANLARLITVPAPLWLLDEPTVGLDTAAVAALDTAIGAHRAKGGIVVAASHITALSPGVDHLDLTPKREAAES